MKTNKKNIKETKTKVKPLFVIEIDPRYNVDDFAETLTIAKFNAKMGLTYQECWDLIKSTLDEYNSFIIEMFSQITDNVEKEMAKNKKDPWYKRLWKKLF